MPEISLPEDAQVLTTEEAVAVIESGDHPEAGAGSPAFDAALIQGLRTGRLMAARLPDGRLALARTTAPSTQVDGSMSRAID